MIALYYIGEIISENNRLDVHRSGRGKGRIHLSREYRQFKDSLSHHFQSQFKSQGHSPIHDYFDMEMSIFLWKMKDTSNPAKPICDALEQAGIIENDRYLRNIHIFRHYHRKDEEDMLLVKLYPLTEEETENVVQEQEQGYRKGY